MNRGEVNFDSYPPDGVVISEKALFEAWDQLEKFREDLVVIGGTEISGIDRFGDDRTYRVPICGMGPLLVLKLNAFAGRTHEKKAKDAYDILAVVSSCSRGAAFAIAAFQMEKEKQNPAMARALDSLAKDFLDHDSLAPRVAEQTHDPCRGAGGDRDDAGCRIAGEIHEGAV